MYTYIIYDNCILHLMFQCLKTIFNISCRPQEYIKSMLIQQPSPTPKDIPALPGVSRPCHELGKTSVFSTKEKLMRVKAFTDLRRFIMKHMG